MSAFPLRVSVELVNVKREISLKYCSKSYLSMNEILLVANSAPFGALATKPLFKRCHFKIVMRDV